jgi:hypothetical protein
MPGRSVNHAKRFPGTAQSNRIAVLDNQKLDCSMTVAPNHQPPPQSRGRGLEHEIGAVLSNW